jgi:glycosyltransferase involved in cell wall biosynthesis
MNIALNAQLISSQAGYRGAGVNNYARRLLHALGQEALAGRTDYRFLAFVHTQGLDFPGVEIFTTGLPLERPAARIAWEQVLLPAELSRQSAGLVHGLVNVLPLSSRVRGVVTVHDLSFVLAPETLPPLKRVYLARLCAASVRRARAVIAVSRQTAGDVVRCFGVPEDKVRVVHNGVAAEFVPPSSPASLDAAASAAAADAAAGFRRARNLPARYWLYLGTLEPRKNLDLLIRAFARWRHGAVQDGSHASGEAAARAVKLVLAGGKGWYYDTIFAQVAELGIAEDVIFGGFVPPAELADWYRGAELFLYPSRFEGFGLPVLEAMACGVPVLCSDAPGLREVAGDAALRLPPGDEEGWANAMQLLYGQPAVRAELRRRGLAQAKRFSWQRSAQQTIQVYNEVRA